MQLSQVRHEECLLVFSRGHIRQETLEESRHDEEEDEERGENFIL